MEKEMEKQFKYISKGTTDTIEVYQGKFYVKYVNVYTDSRTV